ncbi:WASH complex subunit 4 [Ditylenchus destructor]|uniref:WASH complex subunit 4 n=1 Tax=Ditylenchus destructor TaxID=166010 RepID=A0AAD4R3E1_9BILA|nr:WASH complex subunit 4 [Ditylenchus destructor]
MDVREQRARVLEREKIRAVLASVKNADSGSGLYERRIVQCSSGVRDIVPSAHDLIKSQNALVDNILLAFVNIANEVDMLVNEARSKFYDGLLLYGEDGESLLERDGGMIEIMSNFLPFLYDLLKFVERCYEVVHHILMQLYALHQLRHVLVLRPI